MDSADLPITEVRYELTHPDGRKTEAVLTGDGTIRCGGLPAAGEFTIQLFAVYNARWSQAEAKVGDTVDLAAETEGYPDGTPCVIRIWERDIGGPDRQVAELDTRVQGNRIEARWEYRHTERPMPAGAGDDHSTYSSPEHYFFVHVGRDRARSGQLKLQDWIEIELKDQDDRPVPDEEYILRLPDGEVRKGRLDANGRKKEEHLPPGRYDVEFPNISDE